MRDHLIDERFVVVGLLQQERKVDPGRRFHCRPFLAALFGMP
jgi:hypothetical protein